MIDSVLKLIKTPKYQYHVLEFAVGKDRWFLFGLF